MAFWLVILALVTRSLWRRRRSSPVFSWQGRSEVLDYGGFEASSEFFLEQGRGSTSKSVLASSSDVLDDVGAGYGGSNGCADMVGKGNSATNSFG